MKKFTVSVLCAAIFFIGLGGLVEKAAAGFKSDERALAIIKQARAAIGGEANIANVRALTISAKATHNFPVEGAMRSEQGDLEINMQLPNQFSKTMKFGDGVKGDSEVRREVNVFVRSIDGEIPSLDKAASADGKRNVVIMRKGEGEPLIVNTDELNAEDRHKFVIRKGDGTTQEAATDDDKKILVDKIKVAHGAVRHNELFRTAFALLLTAPEGTDASYTFAGEADVDGNSCNVIVAQTGGESFKLYLDKSTSLPRMMSFQAVKPLVFRLNKEDAKASGEKTDQIVVRRAAGESLEKAEFQVKFSDFRSVGGLQLPFSWTQTVAGQTDQTINILNYEINPAGIAEKFSKELHKIRLRTQKPL
jgi:hypothetical protein